MASKCYAGLDTLKARIGLDSVTTHDAKLLSFLNTATEKIDTYCSRNFQPETATKYYDGDYSPLIIDDLLSVTNLKLDKDRDDTYEETMTADQDYNLLPLNGYPKTRIEISTLTDKDYTSFAAGVKKGVELEGIFGYGDGKSATPYLTSGDATAEAVDASEASIDVTLYSNFEPGQTILIDDEQMYISDTTDDTQDYITVERAVNGTTAATHTTATTIYIYRYPEVIKESCIIIAAELFRYMETAYSGVISTDEFGSTNLRQGMNPTVRMLLDSGNYVLRRPS